MTKEDYRLLAHALLMMEPCEDVWGGIQQTQQDLKTVKATANSPGGQFEAEQQTENDCKVYTRIVRLDRINHIVALYDIETKHSVTLFQIEDKYLTPTASRWYLKQLFCSDYEKQKDFFKAAQDPANT